MINNTNIDVLNRPVIPCTQTETESKVAVTSDWQPVIDGIENWPPNALRHSFASYHLERFKQPGTLTVEMGHSDPDLISRFYRRRVRPEAARRWWSIMPSAFGNIIEAEFAATS